MSQIVAQKVKLFQNFTAPIFMKRESWRWNPLTGFLSLKTHFGAQKPFWRWNNYLWNGALVLCSPRAGESRMTIHMHVFNRLRYHVQYRVPTLQYPAVIWYTWHWCSWAAVARRWQVTVIQMSSLLMETWMWLRCIWQQKLHWCHCGVCRDWGTSDWSGTLWGSW